MSDLGKPAGKDIKRAEAAAKSLTEEMARKKAYLAKEEAIEASWKAEAAKRAEKHAAGETAELAGEQQRKKALLAREQAIAEQAKKGKPR